LTVPHGWGTINLLKQTTGTKTMSLMKLPTTLEKSIHDSFEELAGKFYTDYESEPSLDTVPHESCDGFFPHTNGGYQLMSYVTLMEMDNKATGFVNTEIDKQYNQYVENSYKIALECFAADNSEKLLQLFPTIDIDKPDDDIVNYHDLYAMGESELAETLNEYEHIYLMESSTFFIQARCFFFSADNHRNQSGENEIYFHAGVNFDFEYGRDSGLEMTYERNVKVSELTPELLKTILTNMYDSI